MSFDKLEEILAFIDADVGLSKSNVVGKIEEKLKQVDTSGLLQFAVLKNNKRMGNVQKSVSSRIFSSTQFSIYLERKYQVET